MATELEARFQYLDGISLHQAFCYQHHSNRAEALRLEITTCRCDKIREQLIAQMSEDPNVVIHLPPEVIIDLGRRITVDFDPVGSISGPSAAIDTDPGSGDSSPVGPVAVGPSDPAFVPGLITDADSSGQPGATT